MEQEEKQEQQVSHDLKYYAREKGKLVESNKKRNIMYRAMDDMWHNDLKLPSQLTSIEGFHQVTPTEPSDSIQTARRLLSTVEPKITYHPLDDTIETRGRADEIEKALMWHYQRASRRSVGNLTSDIVLSSLLYDSIDAFVEYIPWQNEISKQVKGKAWETSGDYCVTVFNSKDVYVKRTNRGVRTVLLYVEMTPDDVIDTWGDMAEEIIEAWADTNGGKDKEWPEIVYYCDRWDDTDRIVWLEFARDAIEIEEKNVITQGPHKLPFIPWVCRAGGSAIDKEPQHQRRPLLTSIYQAKSWTTQAIMESLLATEAIKTGAAPLTISKTNDGKTPRIDYTNIGGNIPVKLNENVEPFPKPQLDHRLTELTDRVGHRMSNSTLPTALTDPSFASGAAFASINAILRASSNVLDPARTLSENALADIFTLELMWLIHKKKPLYAYNHDKKSKSYGANLTVDPEEIEPTDIYITVNLSANLPLDKISEINAVSLIMDKFGVSKEQALEMLDFVNAAAMIEDGVQEAMTNAEVGNAIKLISAKGDAEVQRIMAQVQLETQQQQMEMQAQAQQGQMQQQQEMAAQQQQAQQPQQDPMAGQMAMMQQQSTAQSAANIAPDQAASELGQLTANMQGMANDPSMGGQSPSGALPGALTREAKTKRTRGGTPIQGA